MLATSVGDAATAGSAAQLHPAVTWSVTWRAAAVGAAGALYLIGLIWQLGRLVADLRRTRRLARGAQPAPAGIDARAAALAGQVPMTAPVVRTSEDIRSPLVIGGLRPMLLLPRGAEGWQPRDLDLALAHELAHVRRRDLAWAWVPAVAQRVFYFHPLARLAVREYVLAREAACDAEAIARMNAAPEDYGRLLLTLGCAPASPLCAAAGATTFITLKRRLVMLERATTPASRWWWALVGVAAVTLVPLTLVATPLPPAPPPGPAATTAPSLLLSAVDAWTAQEVDVPPLPARAPQAPPTPPAPPAPPAVPDDSAPAAAPAAPAPPAPPTPPAAPPAPPRQHGDRAGRDVAWVLFDADSGRQSVHAANRDDVDEARRLRRGDEAMVWFRRNGIAYVSRDAPLLDAVRDSFAAVNAIGERLSAAGSRIGREGAAQGQVGTEQGARGAAMVTHGSRIAEVTGKLMVLDGERMQAGDRRMTSAQAARRAELRAELESIEREMAALADQQRALARQMKGKAALMREEGRKMAALGSEMRRAVDQAMARVTSLFD